MTRTGRVLLRENNRGVALLEYALVLPVILIILAIAFDTMQFLNHYQVLVDVARAGTRFGQSIPELESDLRGTIGAPESGLRTTITLDPCSDLSIDRLATDPTYAYPPKHLLIHGRIRQSLCIHAAAARLYGATALHIQTELKPSSLPTEDRDTLEVSLRTDYDAMFPLLSFVPLRVRSIVPYLY